MQIESSKTFLLWSVPCGLFAGAVAELILHGDRYMGWPSPSRETGLGSFVILGLAGMYYALLLNFPLTWRRPSQLTWILPVSVGTVCAFTLVLESMIRSAPAARWIVQLPMVRKPEYGLEWTDDASFLKHWTYHSFAISWLGKWLAVAGFCAGSIFSVGVIRQIGSRFRRWYLDTALGGAAALFMIWLTQYAITMETMNSGNFVHDGILHKSWQAALLFALIGVTYWASDLVRARLDKMTTMPSILEPSNEMPDAHE